MTKPEVESKEISNYVNKSSQKLNSVVVKNVNWDMKKAVRDARAVRNAMNLETKRVDLVMKRAIREAKVAKDKQRLMKKEEKKATLIAMVERKATRMALRIERKVMMMSIIERKAMMSRTKKTTMFIEGTVMEHNLASAVSDLVRDLKDDTWFELNETNITEFSEDENRR